MHYRVNVINDRFIKKLLSASIVFIMILASFAVFFVDTVKAQPPSPNEIIVTPSAYNVTVGDTFNIPIYVNVSWEIDNVTITNITFEPVGKLNYTATSQGDLFSGGQWLSPESPGSWPGGGIYNSSGYAKPIAWNNTAVNNTYNKTANITWYANNVGVVYINITGVTCNDSGTNYTTNILNGTVTVHPQAPATFDATTLTDTQIRLNFTHGQGANNIVIRRLTGMDPPMNITDGIEVFNGTGTSYVDSNLNPDTTYSYSSWGWNSSENLYSFMYNATGTATYQGGPGWFIQEHYSDVADRYIENNTEKKFNFSFVAETGGPTSRLHNLTIILPENLTYVGNNGTTVQNQADFTVYNTSNMITWDATDYANGFLYDGTKYFWFNASALEPLEPLQFQINAYNNYSEYQTFNMAVFVTTNFSFTGSIKDIDGNAIEGATANITVSSFSSGGPPVTLGYFTANTNATGQFNVTGIPTTEENVSGLQQGGPMGPGGGGDLFYALSAENYEPTDTYAINISTSLPSVSIGEFVTLLNNPEIFLKTAISFRVNTTGPNYNWSSKQIDNYTPKIFQIMVKDLRLGYPIKEFFTNSYEKIFSVPAGRNYSLSIFPSQSFPVSVRFYNITSTCEGSGDFNITGVNTTCTPYNGTYLVNVSINVSYNHRWLNGSFNGVSEIEDMRVVVYIMEDQDMVFENWALPFNLANESGGNDDSYNTATGVYNISLPATMAPSYIMLRAYAKNTSGIYYMGSHIISSSGGNLSESIYNFTMSPLIQGGINRSITSNNVSNNWSETTIVNTTAVLFNLVNSTGCLLSNENAFIEVKRELEGTDYMQMIDASNGQFNISLMQGASLKKLTIYSQQYAPISTYVSADVLSGITSTDTITCSNGICNITMRSFGNFDPLGDKANMSFSMGMYSSNSTCNVPNPPAICDLCGSQNESEFSPFNAILKGDVNLMISCGNISVYYLNVDLLASGPPDAVFTQNATESQGGLEAAWKFGSQGPDIYDAVLMKIPYPDNLINKTIKVSIPVLYDNEFNEIWNSSVNTTADISTDSRLSGYADYLNTPYEAYLNGSGVICNESDPTLSSGLGYKDNTANQTIWIKIPHFTGVGTLVAGDTPDPPTSFTATKSSTSQINLTWTLGDKSDYTRIQRNTGSYPSSINSGTNVYNSTGTSKSDTGLSAGTTYYYSAWSWNITEELWSTTYATASATTDSEGGDGTPPGGVIATTTDDPPTISDVSHTPTTVTSKDTVIVSATVTDDNTVSSVLLYWNDGSEHNKSMSAVDSNYSTTFGPFTELTTVTYWINATDDASQSTDSSTSSFTVSSNTSGPTITIVNPASGSTIYDTTPIIKASYSSLSSIIDTDNVILTIDGSSVNATITSSSVTYIPSTSMIYGSHTISLIVSDTLGNNNTKEWSFTIVEPVSIAEKELGNVTSGEEREIIPENSDETGIDAIDFTLASNLTDVKIFVAKLKAKPEDVTDLPSDKTLYIYLHIKLTSDGTSLNDEDVEILKINFKVEKTWITSNKIDKQKVTLMRYHNGAWEALITSYLSEDDTYVYYEAELSGLSNFAVVGATIVIEEEPEGELPVLWIVLIIIVIIVIIIGLLFKAGYLYIEEEKPKNETSKKSKNNFPKTKK